MLFEYSATNRATCRAKDCKKKIDKDALRVGEEYGENPYNGEPTNIGFRHWGCMTAFLFKKIKTEGGARAVKGFDKLSYEDQNMVLKRCKEPLNPPLPTEDESHSPSPASESTAGTSKAGSSKADSVSGAKSKAKKRKREDMKDSEGLPDGEKDVEEEEEEEKPKKKKKSAVKK